MSYRAWGILIRGLGSSQRNSWKLFTLLFFEKRQGLEKIAYNLSFESEPQKSKKCHNALKSLKRESCQPVLHPRFTLKTKAKLKGFIYTVITYHCIMKYHDVYSLLFDSSAEYGVVCKYFDASSECTCQMCLTLLSWLTLFVNFIHFYILL